MDSLLNVSRRGLVKWGLAAAGLPMLAKAFRSSAFAQDASAEGGKKARSAAGRKKNSTPRKDCREAGNWKSA